LDGAVFSWWYFHQQQDFFNFLFCFTLVWWCQDSILWARK
jgi:hypothetical protein